MILCGENRQKTFAQCDEGMSLLKHQMIESFLYLVLISPLNIREAKLVNNEENKTDNSGLKSGRFVWVVISFVPRKYSTAP